MIENKFLDVISEKEYDLINIKEDCLFLDYAEMEKEINLNGNIPTRLFIREGNNIFNSIIKKQKIYTFIYKDIEYLISVSDKEINISQRKIEDNNIIETVINLYEDKKFSVSKYIHGLDHSTKFHKTYNTNKKSLVNIFDFDKIEAMALAQQLLDELKDVDFIYKIINTYPIYDRLNLIPSTWYNPIISDDEITLSSNRYSSIDTVNYKKICSFNIILNNTKEQIGKIAFNLEKGNFTYDGNVGYEIKEEFRNMGYASRALKLLKEIVKTNKYVGDKDLFVSTSPDNIYSQKVAINNDGQLIYEGDVPEKDPFNYKHRMDKVKVYQIRMNREQINN